MRAIFLSCLNAPAHISCAQHLLALHRQRNRHTPSDRVDHRGKPRSELRDLLKLLVGDIHLDPDIHADLLVPGVNSWFQAQEPAQVDVDVQGRLHLFDLDAARRGMISNPSCPTFTPFTVSVAVAVVVISLSPFRYVVSWVRHPHQGNARWTPSNKSILSLTISDIYVDLLKLFLVSISRHLRILVITIPGISLKF